MGRFYVLGVLMVLNDFQVSLLFLLFLYAVFNIFFITLDIRKNKDD